MSKGEIQERMKELRKELIKLNSQRSTGTTPEKPGRIKQLKKTIAKMLTELKSKENEETKEVKTK